MISSYDKLITLPEMRISQGSRLVVEASIYDEYGSSLLEINSAKMYISCYGNYRGEYSYGYLTGTINSGVVTFTLLESNSDIRLGKYIVQIIVSARNTGLGAYRKIGAQGFLIVFPTHRKGVL
jgi:hypothetical protein